MLAIIIALKQVHLALYYLVYKWLIQILQKKSYSSL
jgi:hypothetical protein